LRRLSRAERRRVGGAFRVDQVLFTRVLCSGRVLRCVVDQTAKQVRATDFIARHCRLGLLPQPTRDIDRDVFVCRETTPVDRRLL
jgi:hypothetical protein